MSPTAGIIILCTFPGILSGILQVLLLKKFGKTGSSYRIIICYIGLFYGILSLVKMILDGGKLTLAECFEDIVSSTYLHYLIPLMLMAVIMPCLIYFIFRSADISGLMSLFDSVMFVILALEFIIMGRISNTSYVITLLISVLAALWGVFFYKGEISYFSRDNLKQRLKYAVPPTLLYVVIVILSLPGTLFLNNRSEITIIPSFFARALLSGAAAYFVLIAGVGILLLTWRQLELFYTVLFAITIAGYIQSMLLNGHMLAMDGGRQTWQGASLWINTLIWIILVAGILLLKVLVHKDVAKVYRAISIYICLIQVVSLGYLAVSTYMTQDTDTDWMLSTEGALELHPDNNVLVFVLDWYDEQILEKILADDPGFLAPLDGFTYYPNATSLYAFTEMSLPYLLSGTEWQYDMGKDEYIEYAYDNGHLLDDIYDAEYSIGLYTHKSYVSSSVTDKLCNYAKNQQGCHVWDTVNLMMKCSKYQMAPFGLKNEYWYTTDQIIDLETNDGFIKWVTYDDLLFHTALSKTGISIDKNSTGTGSFKFYHMCGAHPPYLTTENFTYTNGGMADYTSMLSQAKGGMKIVFEYIEQLKELDMYDSSTIIITADHGENYIYDPSRVSLLSDLQLESTSSPILLVKSAGQAGEGIKMNSAPVSHTEVIASIVSAINPQTAANYGNTLGGIVETADRERIFTFYRSDLPYVRTSITGDVLDAENWTIIPYP